jgi:diaminohydroxyphosphoribosylaminopyrimidine deaminase/5-amino-6-(5-phosphoribosylamino)uracil reductase
MADAVDDLALMGRALELAERGRGGVEPNPLVGAVLVRNGRIVGTGWHERYGGPHAEIVALEQAGGAARGADLYVTLEPCCHHGKTPPCTSALIQAGIRRVVAAVPDPFAQVAGQGFTLLRDHGIEVEIGLNAAEAAELNAPYLKLLRTGRPYVIAKWAMSLDGKTATHTGASRWITSEAARQRVHAIRGRMDAIIAGIGTVLADDPLLTARPPGPRVAARVILDRSLRLPLDSQLVQTARTVPVLIVHAPSSDPARRLELEARGCECLALNPYGTTPFLAALLDELGRRRWTNVLVEGGSEVLGSFFTLQAVDEVQVFIAPKLVGGRGALSPVGGAGIANLDEALALAELHLEQLGPDVLVRGRLRSDVGNAFG